MDTTAYHRQIVKEIITQYAQLRPSHGNIRLDTVFDENQDRYALMQVGWDRGMRIRGNLIYITLQDSKVWIEYDGMEAGITDDLIYRGILAENIVLAFIPSEDVQLTA
ncbi:XisI protein [Fortiea contorta]|uniref:XisI protein n=1 Tax=Fortiea contorta TaxID=1892405 RepID=UPI0003469827|nr:XisI protein [Fortiea contorta]